MNSLSRYYMSLAYDLLIDILKVRDLSGSTSNSKKKLFLAIIKFRVLKFK